MADRPPPQAFWAVSDRRRKGRKSQYSYAVPELSSHHSLNRQQQEAAQFGSGPLLIIAGAGTGKTNTLAHRVAHLVLSGARPERILLLTFTRRAALEMTRRTQRIVESVRFQVPVPVPEPNPELERGTRNAHPCGCPGQAPFTPSPTA